MKEVGNDADIPRQSGSYAIIEEDFAQKGL